MMISISRATISLSQVGKITLPACACLALLVPNPALARSSREGEGRIAECIRQVAGGKLWLEKALWGLRDQEAGWLGAEVPNTNGSHDLGPLQVNSWWVPKIAGLVGRSQADVRAWLMHDACFNAGAARWILLSAIRRTGDLWTAIGVYHSPTAWRQKRYAVSVARHIQRRFGRDVFLAPATIRDARQVNVANVDEANPRTTKIRMHGFGILSDPPS